MYKKTMRNTVKRTPNRASYDKKSVYEIIDDSYICHVGFDMGGQPYIIPMTFGRDGNTIYIHGSPKSRLFKHLTSGIPICLSFAHVDGLVLARSAFHHSMNYRSVAAFGVAKEVAEEEKNHAFEVLFKNMLADRWEESRLPNAKEISITYVLAIEIEQASAKVRNGPPVDDKEDYELDIWAGIIPIHRVFGEPVADPKLKAGIELPKSVTR